jgi:DNA-binding beta-propeller fold protein YncE
VISGKTNAVERTIAVGGFPNAVATEPLIGKAFISNLSSDSITVIP